MKKYCLIVKTETYSGITLMVEDDFDEDFDSPILKGVLKDFPLESRRPIIKNEEIDIINEGDDIKIDPEYSSLFTIIQYFFISLPFKY